MEPLESTSIHLIQVGISKLITLFPDKRFAAAEIDKYNQQTIRDFELIRDFLFLHYKVTKRNDSRFWRYCRSMEIPARLQQKIDLFLSSGRIYREDEELFTDTRLAGCDAWPGPSTPRPITPWADASPTNKTQTKLNAIPKAHPSNGVRDARSQPLSTTTLAIEMNPLQPYTIDVEQAGMEATPIIVVDNILKELDALRQIACEEVTFSREQNSYYPGVACCTAKKLCTCPIKNSGLNYSRGLQDSELL